MAPSIYLSLPICPFLLLISSSSISKEIVASCRYFQSITMCVCVCVWKKTERRMRSVPWSVLVVQTRRRDLPLHLHDGTITQGGKEEERQAKVGYNVCKNGG